MKGKGIVKLSGRGLGLGVLGCFCVASLWLWLPRAAAVPQDIAPATVDLVARAQAKDETLAGFIAITSERPLFHASRRPEPQATPVTAAPPPEPTLTLVGILRDGDVRLALVRTSTSPQLYRLEANARLDAWEVLEIRDNAIRVRKDGEGEQVLVIGQ